MKKLEQLEDNIRDLIDETRNHSIKESLKKLIPKKKIIDRIQKKDISQEEYNNTIRQACLIIYPEIEKKYPYRKWIEEKQSLSSKLSIALITCYSFQYALSFSSKKVKFYPISIDEKTAKEIYKNELLTIIQEHIKTGRNIEDIIEYKAAFYDNKVHAYKETLSGMKIEPYYGTPDFMYERASYINECLKKLPFETKNLDSELREMKKFLDKYPNLSQNNYKPSYPYFNKTYKMAYDEFEKIYLTFINCENSLSNEISKIWQDYLTDPLNHNNNEFHYLIHTFTNGIVSPEQMTKICCSLATDKLLTPPNGNSGLIYKYSPNSVETLCPEDAGSYIFNEAKFIDLNLPLDCELTENHISYENPRISKLILPTYLESIAIENNLKYNQELLNYKTFCAYSEILLNSEAKAIGVFYTDECPNIEEIQEYAKKHNLPLIHLSLKQLRVQQGLSPEPEKIEENEEVNIQKR